MLNRLAARPPTRLPTKRPEPPIVCCNPGNPFGHPIGRLLGGPGVRRCKCAGRRRQAAALVGVAWRCGQRKNRPATHQRPAYLYQAAGNRPCLGEDSPCGSPERAQGSHKDRISLPSREQQACKRLCFFSQTQRASPGRDLGVHKDFMLFNAYIAHVTMQTYARAGQALQD